MLGAGCVTTGKNEPDPKQMSKLARLAAFNGTVIRLLNHPDDMEKFVSVRDTLQKQIDLGEFSPAAFAVTMQMLPINELRSTEAALVIGSVLILWDEYAGQITDLDEIIFIRPVMIAVVDGLTRGIETVQASNR